MLYYFFIESSVHNAVTGASKSEEDFFHAPKLQKLLFHFSLEKSPAKIILPHQTSHLQRPNKMTLINDRPGSSALMSS